MESRFKNILKSLILIALGILFPAVTGHFGLESILLTMHIPILLAGFLLPINYSVFCGMATPILCTIFLGEPSVFPILPLIICETIALTSFANIFYVALHWKIYPALILTMLLGILVLFSAASILSWVVDGFSAVSYTSNSFVVGLPGFVLQILIIPIILKIAGLISRRKAEESAE